MYAHWQTHLQQSVQCPSPIHLRTNTWLQRVYNLEKYASNKNKNKRTAAQPDRPYSVHATENIFRLCVLLSRPFTEHDGTGQIKFCWLRFFFLRFMCVLFCSHSHFLRICAQHVNSIDVWLRRVAVNWFDKNDRSDVGKRMATYNELHGNNSLEAVIGLCLTNDHIHITTNTVEWERAIICFLVCGMSVKLGMREIQVAVLKASLALLEWETPQMSYVNVTFRGEQQQAKKPAKVYQRESVSVATKSTARRTPQNNAFRTVNHWQAKWSTTNSIWSLRPVRIMALALKGNCRGVWSKYIGLRD